MTETCDYVSPMDKYLRLCGRAESDFWTCEATVRQTQLFDMLGLSFSIVTNLVIVSSMTCPEVYRQCCAASAVAIALQMLWSLLHRRSYMRLRVLAMAAHRLRWYLMALMLCLGGSSPWEAALSPIRGQVTAAGPITWRALAAIAGYPPLAMIHQSFSFPLPYRYALVSSTLLLVSYPLVFLNQQARAVELLNLHSYAYSACMATPLAALPTSQQLCSSKAGHMLLLMYMFTVAGVLLPLQLVHWQESNAKQLFMRSRGVGMSQGDGSVPTLLVVTVWAVTAQVIALAMA